MSLKSHYQPILPECKYVACCWEKNPDISICKAPSLISLSTSERGRSSYWPSHRQSKAARQKMSPSHHHRATITLMRTSEQQPLSVHQLMGDAEIFPWHSEPWGALDEDTYWDQGRGRKPSNISWEYGDIYEASGHVGRGSSRGHLMKLDGRHVVPQLAKAFWFSCGPNSTNLLS